MGTKIEYAINLLKTSPNSNSFTVNGVDDWNYYLNNTGIKVKSRRSRLEDKIQKSMDKMFDKNNADSIRRTMQMHEDVFKCQVKELHRLYDVQKKLMGELKREIKQTRTWDPRINNNSDISHSQLINWQSSTAQFTSAAAAASNNFHIQRLRDDLNSREMSGSCSGDTMRISRGFDLERPATEEDMSTGVSALDEDQAAGSSSHHIVYNKGSKMIMSANVDGLDEDSTEVELTLSIGSSSCLSKKKSKRPHQLNLSASFKTDQRSGGDFSDPTTPMSSSSATFDHERNQSRWLFHGLKLK